MVPIVNLYGNRILPIPKTVECPGLVSFILNENLRSEIKLSKVF